MSNTIDNWADSSADPAGFEFVETVDPEPVPDQLRVPGAEPVVGWDGWLTPTTGDVASPKRSDSGGWLDAHAWAIVAVAGALPALRLRAAWVVVCVVVAVGLRAVESARGQRRTKGTADLVVVPARVAARLLVGALNPLTWLRIIFGGLVAVTAGVLTAGTIGAAKWLVSHGTDGILAATRMGVWAHALTYAAFGAGILLLAGSGETRAQRGRTARQFARGNIPAVNPFSSSLTQLGGVFIIGRDGIVQLGHAATPVFTYPPIDDCLAVLDHMQVSRA